MIDLYFRDNILKTLDNAITEVNRDSFNLSVCDLNNIKLRIENVKKCIFDIYALKIAGSENA